MLSLVKFQELLRIYQGEEEATAFLLSCARAFMDYTHALYDKELARLAYPKEQTEEALYRSVMKELDNAIAEAHQLVLANGSGLNRMAAKAGMPIVYRETGVGAEEEPALSFVREVLEGYAAGR